MRAEFYQNPRPRGERTDLPLTHPDEQPSYPDTPRALRVSVHVDVVSVRSAPMSVRSAPMSVRRDPLSG